MNKLALILFLAGAPALAQFTTYPAGSRPDCGTTPYIIIVSKAASSSDCSTTGGGTYKVFCACDGAGTYFALGPAGGGGGSGDITDVWSCTTGNCNALTAASGDALNASSADSSIPWVVGASPAPTTEGRAAWDSAADRLAVGNGSTTSIIYPGTRAASVSDGGPATTATALASNGANCSAGSYPLGVDASGAVESCTAVVSRLPSWNNPPASASSLDCEFDSAVCGSWSLSSGMSSGTVDPAASISGGADFVYDFTSAPGRMLVQSNGDSVTYKAVTSPTVSLATNFTIFARFAPLSTRNFASAEGEVFLEVKNSSDSNESIIIGLNNNGGALYNRCLVQNNGSYGATGIVGYGPNDATQTAQPQYWLLVVTGTSIKCYAGAAEDAMVYIGELTKTGVTTGWDSIRMLFASANDSPSPIWSLDFIRYYSSNTFAIWNP